MDPNLPNVFNTFSFKKWKDSKKLQEVEDESRRLRSDQVRRLKERLRLEKLKNGKGTGGDLDLEALIEALQRGEDINEDKPIQPPEPEKPKPVIIYEDDDILDEIRKYQANHEELPEEESHSWKYNRRLREINGKEAEAQNNAAFKYNRIVTRQ